MVLGKVAAAYTYSFEAVLHLRPPSPRIFLSLPVCGTKKLPLCSRRVSSRESGSETTSWPRRRACTAAGARRPRSAHISHSRFLHIVHPPMRRMETFALWGTEDAPDS